MIFSGFSIPNEHLDGKPIVVEEGWKGKNQNARVEDLFVPPKNAMKTKPTKNFARSVQKSKIEQTKKSIGARETRKIAKKRKADESKSPTSSIQKQMKRRC